ncbi:xanthine dehydrogenase family protein molybdopterin-binding subunit [Nioella aestuarii]|uniref:xanthine dehydrogenase family protein molybdopterin-binding subunit n=1 Tax=Nioella aestuarii TaxID=1662864 RepID=UPI003D7F2152
MSRAGKIARRSFLIGSAVLAGGVAFGLYTVRRPHENPLEAGLEPGEVTFNPWVVVGPERITLITPHVDLGQGVAHMQAMLLAEEMRLEPGQFDISFGDPSPAYWNTAMGEEAAPFLSSDQSFSARTARTVMGAALKVLGMQVTGGSSSTPDSFDKLRQAGAMARETLRRAGEVRTSIPLDQLHCEAGAVVLVDGTRIPYTELSAQAALLDPVQDAPLTPRSDWRLIGQDTERLDILAKSTGQQVYGIDLTVDGMVHAAVRVNPRRGVLNSFDASTAQAMRGVARVLEVTNGVAVVADNTWRAFQAVNAIDCDWGPSPYPADQAVHWTEVAASFTQDRLDREWRHDGDVDAALTGDVIEAEYRAPYVAHQPLEPLNAIVQVTETGVEVWTAHQMPRFLQQQVAAVTGHDADQVTFHNQFAGGSFGHRLEFEHVKLATEIALQMPGVPVKLTYQREEDFAQDFPRQIGMARARGSVANGVVAAADIQIAAVSPTRSQMGRLGQNVPGPDSQIPAGVWNAPYAIPSYRVRAYAVPELAPTSSWRSVGASSGGFFGESFLDELIYAAGADPLAERLRLANDPRAVAVLEAVGEMSGWGRSLAANRGLGIAMVESFGVPTAEVIEVEATPQGIRIHDVWIAAEVGTVVDPIGFENQVQGGVIWGLGHAINCEITYADGIAEQSNYDWHEGMRIWQAPRIAVRGVELGGTVRGIGEPPVPPAAPALANAIFAATGQRLREMPFNKFVDFV